MSFSFAENRDRVLRAPLYALSTLVARCWVRDRNLWVFGRRQGVGEGPLAVYREARHDPHLRLVWLTQDAEQAAQATAEGIEHHPVDSWSGRWLTLRAGVLVLAYGLGDVARPFAAGAHVLQTWHGAPLKKIHLDSPVSSSSRLFTWLFRRSGKLIGTVPAGSELVAERFRSAWGWSDADRVPALGDPRCDTLFRIGGPQAPDGAAAEARRHTRALLADLWGTTEADLPAHLVLYAPTWRDGEVGPSLAPEDLTEELVADLRRADAWLVLRSHPSGSTAGAFDDPDLPVRLLLPETLNDVNGALPGFDALVTDYSAIAIDYAALGRPVVGYVPDLAEYTARRGLYEPYEVFSGGAHAATWGPVVRMLADALTDPAALEALAERTGRQLQRRYHARTDGRSAARVVARVRSRVGLAPYPAPEDAGVRTVVHVTEALGGVEIYLRLLVEHWDDPETRLSFVLATDGPFATWLRGRGHEVRVTAMPRTRGKVGELRGVAPLRQVLDELGPDLVHLHSSQAGFLGRLALRGSGTPVVYTPHAFHYLGRTGLSRQVFLRAERVLDRVCPSTVVGTSPSEHRRVVEEVRVPGQRATWLLNGVAVPAQGGTGRTTGSTAGVRPMEVGMVGRVTHQKNIEMFLRVVVEMRGEPVRFTLIGAGHYADDRARLEAAMAATGVGAEELTVLDWMPHEELLAWKERCDAIVLTSRYESYGYVLAEAAARGVPVVGTRVDGLRDIVLEERTGLLVDPDDHRGMAAALRSLADPTVRASYGRAAAQHAREVLSVERFVRQLSDLYTSVGPVPADA